MDDNDLIMRGSLPFRDDIKIPSIYALGDGKNGGLRHFLLWLGRFSIRNWWFSVSRSPGSPAAAHPGILNPPTHGFLL